MQGAAVLLSSTGSQSLLWGALTIVFHLVLVFFLSPVSKGKAKWECWPYWEQSSGCTVYSIVVVEQSRGGIPISPLAVRLCCYSPWCWFWCFELCCELGHGKDPRQKHGRGEKRDFLFCFPAVLFACWELCWHNWEWWTVMRRWKLLTPAFLSTLKYSATVPSGQQSFVSCRARSSANRPCLQQSPVRCNDLLWCRLNWLHWTLNSCFFAKGWGPEWWGWCFKQNSCSCPEG